jgi:hypothetical protein
MPSNSEKPAATSASSAAPTSTQEPPIVNYPPLLPLPMSLTKWADQICKSLVQNLRKKGRGSEPDAAMSMAGGRVHKLFGDS